MTVLVTGGAGFIGQHVSRALMAAGHEVRVLDSLRAPIHPPGTRPALMDELDFIHGDVTDPVAVRKALTDVDRVFHLASYQDYMPDFSRFFHVNVAGTALLYETIVQERLPVERVVVVSSQAVYGEGHAICERCGDVWPRQRSEAALAAGDWACLCPTCGAPVQHAPTAEDAPLSPHNPYGMSKRGQEEVALNLGERYGIPTTGLRYSIAVGAGQSVHNTYSGAVRSFLVRVMGGRPPVIFEDGHQLRDYVGIDDIVAATLLVSTDERAVGLAFNVGGGHEVSVLQVAEMVLGVMGSELEPEITREYRAGDTRNIISDLTALQSLGWTPRHDLRTAIAEYAEWLQRGEVPYDSFDRASEKMRELGVLRSASA